MLHASRRIGRLLLPMLWPALWAAADEPTHNPAVGVIRTDSDPPSFSERIGPSIRLVSIAADQVCAGHVGEPASEERRGREAILLPWPTGDSTCWVAGLARVATAAAGSGCTYVVGDPGDAVSDPATFGYLLKRAAVTLRAADPSAHVLAGPLPGDAPWLESIGGLGLGPYLDGLATRPEALAVVLEARDRAFATAGVWSVERAAPQPGEPPGLIRAANALAAGADVALVFASTASDLDALAALVREAPQGARPASSPTVLPAVGHRSPVLELIGDAGDRIAVLPASDEAWVLGIGPPPAGVVEVIDPGGGRRDVPVRRARGALPIIRIDAAGSPLLLAIRPAAGLMAEQMEVGQQRPGLTAEEIVARDREVRARQALRLDHFQARARVAYRFTIANFDETLDVVSENDAFGRGDAIEYRQVALYVNGSLWKGEPPEFPFISREKVLEVPLALSLREGYRYVLEGEEAMGGRTCYRIAFEPGPEAAGDFRGTVWIDRESFLRARMDLVRLAPAQPVISDVLTQWYAEVETEAGSFRLITRMEGQMVFSALGQDAIVDRRVELRDFRLNEATFDQERQSALTSRDRMYRDSLEEGLVALVRDPKSGERTASGVGPDSNTLLLMGWHGSLDGELGGPFAGINWFDLNWRDRGIQLDVAWALVAGAVSVTWPRSESAWEASLQLLVTAVPRRDRYVDETGKVPDEQLDRLDELLQATFRRPLGPYFTLAVEPSLSYLSLSRRGGTRDDYVLPPDTAVPGLALRLGYHRAGLRLGLWSDVQHRLDWGPYGLPEDLATTVRDTPIRWGVSLNRSFYFRKLDRLSLNLDLYDGTGLDRFSAFQRLSLDDTGVLGFSSAGLRFTQGALTDIGYAWRMGGNVRWEASLGGGVFRSPEDYGEDWQSAYGASLAASFPGPWGTMFRVRTAFGIDASLPVSGSDGSTRLSIVKTFPGWWPWNRIGKEE